MTNLQALDILHRIQQNLLTAEQKLNLLDIKGAEQMGISPTVADIIKAVDDASNKIAARIAALVANSGLTADEKAAFQAEVDKLNALGSDGSAASIKG